MLFHAMNLAVQPMDKDVFLNLSWPGAEVPRSGELGVQSVGIDGTGRSVPSARKRATGDVEILHLLSKTPLFHGSVCVCEKLRDSPSRA